MAMSKLTHVSDDVNIESSSHSDDISFKDAIYASAYKFCLKRKFDVEYSPKVIADIMDDRKFIKWIEEGMRSEYFQHEMCRDVVQTIVDSKGKIRIKVLFEDDPEESVVNNNERSIVNRIDTLSMPSMTDAETNDSSDVVNVVSVPKKSRYAVEDESDLAASSTLTVVPTKSVNNANYDDQFLRGMVEREQMTESAVTTVRKKHQLYCIQLDIDRKCDTDNKATNKLTFISTSIGRTMYALGCLRDDNPKGLKYRKVLVATKYGVNPSDIRKNARDFFNAKGEDRSATYYWDVGVARIISKWEECWLEMLNNQVKDADAEKTRLQQQLDRFIKALN
jgi:hypothetical protein